MTGFQILFTISFHCFVFIFKSFKLIFKVIFPIVEPPWLYSNCPFHHFLNPFLFSCIPIRFVRNSRVLGRQEILIELLRAAVEPNPGPIQDDPSVIAKQEPISSIDIITINCNGLTSDLRLLQAIGKIKKIAKNKNFIFFLQETHYANIILLESIWEGSTHVSMGSSGSKGVITLTTKNLKVTSFKSDTEGRYLFTTIQVSKNHVISTANIYSPNDFNISKQFISNTFNDWDQFQLLQRNSLPPTCKFSSVFAGDLNCAIYCSDSQNRSWSNKEIALADHISALTEERELYNSSLQSSNGNNFTWNRGDTFSKIDHIFVSHDLLNSLNSYDTIWNFVKSDHAAIKISIAFDNSIKRGRSFTKLFLSDLKEDGAIEFIRKEIEQAVKDFPRHWNPHQKLDFIKLVIRTNVLELRAKNKSNITPIETLRAKLDSYNASTFLDEQQAKDFNHIRSELYRQEELEAEKHRIMAGVKWIEEGERSTKFFLNAINTNRAQSTVDYLNTPNGPTYNIGDILCFSKDFYRNLYTKRRPEWVEGFYNDCPTLSEAAKRDLSDHLTIKNLKDALATCKDSTPGLDGIPYSYYRIFNVQLLPLLLDSWNFSTQTGKLPQSQSTSVILLIPKVGKDKHEIKNWRPISISPCDLKIITKALSIKVGTHLGEIMSDSQMGYIPGCDINFNNRLMRTALEHCKNIT